MFDDELSERNSQRVMFYLGTRPDKEASAREGRPIFVECPFVKIFQAGDSFTVIDVPVWDDANHAKSHTKRFPKEWEAFKAGVSAEQQSGGTPLKMMPGISQAQVRELEHFHCYTVEQLADISDSNGGKFMGIQSLKNEARSYLLRAKGGAADKALQRELASRDQEIELLKSQMQELLAGRNAKRAPAEDAPDEVPTSARKPPARKSPRA